MDSRYKDWEYLPLAGACGGMGVIWDKRVTSKVNSLHGSFLVSAFLDIKGRHQ